LDHAVRKYVLLAVVALAAGAGLAAWNLFGVRRTPAGQPALEWVTAGTLPGLQDSFNRAVDQTRVLVLLSPT
jgi:hypothetical protein